MSGNVRDQRLFIFLLMLSASYWYCLPVVTQRLVGYNEFRVYDFFFVILIVVLLFKYFDRLRALIKKDKPGKWLLRFSIWASLTSLITIGTSVVGGRPLHAFTTVMFLFHLWGFLFTYFAIRLIVKTQRQCLMLLDVFLVIGAIEATIICLQGVGLVPRFWGRAYDIYGSETFSATLGPNRSMPGHALIMVFAVALGYWRNLTTVGVARVALASVAAVTSLAGLGITGSVTAWAAFLAFGVAAVIVQRPPVTLIAFVAVAAIGIAIAVPGAITNRITNIYENRITVRLEGAEKDNYLEQFQEIDSGRYDLWVDGVKGLIREPWLIPLGGGFNNYSYMGARGASAHNLYITLIVETGLVGLFFYLAWFGGVWRESASLIALNSQNQTPSKRAFLPVDMKALIVGFGVSLFAGEVLYPYRPVFTIMGMFLLLCAVMNHPAMTYQIKTSRQLALRRRLLAGRNPRRNGIGKGIQPRPVRIPKRPYIDVA